MPPSRKSKRSRRTKRKSRRFSRASKRQRGGAEIVLSCTLGPDNKVVVTPPAGLTVDTSKVNTLTITPTVAVHDIKFAATTAKKAVDPRYLGSGAGIIIQQGTTALVPAAFTGVRALLATQKKLAATSPAAVAPMTISNLNTSNLGLSATDRAFTITLTTA